MHVFVRDLAGHSIQLEADSVESLQFAVADRIGIPTSEQRLVFGRQQLVDGSKASLESLGLREGNTIGLALRLRGGGPKKRCGCFVAPTERCSQPALRIVGDCGFCSKSFCGRHRLPEDHTCEGLESCKKDAHDKLRVRLEGEKTSTEKIKSF